MGKNTGKHEWLEFLIYSRYVRVCVCACVCAGGGYGKGALTGDADIGVHLRLL